MLLPLIKLISGIVPLFYHYKIYGFSNGIIAFKIISVFYTAIE